MTRRNLVLAALALGMPGLILGGCREPTEMIPVAPPGIGYTRVPPHEVDEPQALGETAAQAPVDPSRKKAVAGTISPPTELGETRTTPSGAKYETLKAGDGPVAKAGETLLIHYTGSLDDGKIFDSSRKGGDDKAEPVPFKIGSGEVIAGWDEAVPGMKVGERRKLTIPPELGYGSKGQSPDIPPGATLIFDIELLGIK